MRIPEGYLIHFFNKKYARHPELGHLTLFCRISVTGIFLYVLFCSFLLNLYEFLLENVRTVNYCVFEGLGILLDHECVARDAHLNLHVLVVMVWKQ